MDCTILKKQLELLIGTSKNIDGEDLRKECIRQIEKIRGLLRLMGN